MKRYTLFLYIRNLYTVIGRAQTVDKLRDTVFKNAERLRRIVYLKGAALPPPNPLRDFSL
jgi:hypothetical protein